MWNALPLKCSIKAEYNVMCVYSRIPPSKFYRLLWSSKWVPFPLHLFWVVPDVTWAELPNECTFHGNEVGVIVRPGAKRSAWNTKRRTPWKPTWPDSAEQNLTLLPRKTFIKTVCVRETTCDVSFWVKATWLPSEFDLHHSDSKCIFAQGLKPVLTQVIEVITLYHHDR